MLDIQNRQYGPPASASGYPAGPQFQFGQTADGGYFSADSREQEGFDPLKLIWYAVHYRWLLAAFLSAGLVAGVMITFLQTPLYRSTAKVEILTAGAKVIQDLEVVSQSSDYRAFETARLKMLSRDLARRVVFELNLTEDEKFLAPTPSFSLMNLVNRITGAVRHGELDRLDAETREALAIGRVLEGLSVDLVRNTSVLSVAFSHPDPSSAAAVANQVTRSFIDQSVDKTSETSDLARQFIERQVRETKLKLQNSERALVDYSKKAGITLTGNDASLIAENIAQLNDALAQAIQDRLVAERYRDQVAQGNAAALPEVFESKSIQATKQKIAELSAAYQEKLATLKPGFPEMRRIKAQIGELQNQIDLEIAAIARSVEIRHRQAREKEAALKRELAGLERQQRAFQDKNIQYTILKREVDSNRSQYDSLIAKLNEVGVGAELRNANASIVDPALVPGAPYSPKLSRTMVMSMALFAALAAALIYLLELMNNTFSVPDQVESELGVPVLGIIPSTAESDLMEAFEDSKSPLSEAYRTLRTSLQFTGTENRMRTILVTSSEPSEGKSTTVYKLANDFAALGRRVLIIDADLRKPRLHRFFNTDNAVGLSNLLSNVVRQGDVISIFHKTANPGITLLPAGTIPPNPVDLLTTQRMGLTLHFCAKKYDLVIIDSPPIMGLSDAPILSRQADATLMVVSSKQVTRRSAKTALARLKSAGGNVVGAALTKFSVNKLDYNYAYRYMHYNYYSYNDAPERIETNAARAGRKSAIGRKLAAAVGDMYDHLLRRVA